MISSLMRQGLCWVSIGLGKQFFSEIDWLNKSDGAFGTILDRTFGVIDDDHNSILERISSTISTLDPKFSASTLSDEVVQDEEEAEASTQSIRIEDE